MQLFPAYVLVGTSLVGFQATAFVTPSLVRHGRVSNPLFSMSTDETRNNVAPEKDLFTEAPTDNPWTQNLFSSMQTLDDEEINEKINSMAIVSSIVGLGFLLYHIDSTVTHHGVATVQQIASRIPLEAWDSYESVLSESPIATKAATSATVYTIGDIVSQRTEGVTLGQLDRGRVLRSLIAGLIGHGPLSHYWYNLLDDFYENVLHVTEWWAFAPKVLTDQATWGPFWNNTYILLLGIMKLESFENIWADVKRTTIPLIISGLKFWVPIHSVTYGLIPVENRLLWVDIVEIAWVTILATQAASSSRDREESDAEAKTK